MSDDLVREYERVIDTGFRSLPIFELPVEDAAYGLLQAFDSHILTEWMVRAHSADDSMSLAQTQMFKFLGEGFILAMRWLLGTRGSVDARPSQSVELAEMGHELIRYGMDYFRASIFYSGYSQGSIEATAYPAERRVRFSHNPSALSPNATWGFAEEVAREWLKKSPASTRLKYDIQSQAAAVFLQTPHRLQDGRVVLRDVSPLLDERVIRAIDNGWDRQRILPADTELGGFRVCEFDAFWRALYTWSVCAKWSSPRIVDSGKVVYSV